jgi:thiosulfate/3-mercaptopyruvate sulfurtransferase
MGFENELETGPGTKLAEKTFHARRDPPDIVDTAWVKSKLGQVVLIDARPVGQYTAEKPKKGMKGGHVPGAINVPWDTFVGPDGKYLDEVAAREKLAKLVDGEIWKGQTVVLYCNSHHAASHLQFQLARLGYGNLKAYDEGMKFWEKQELPLRGGSQP